MKPKMSRALVAQCKESACNARGLGSIPGLGRSPREGKGYPLQYSGLENSMDCIVRGVTKSRTRLSDFHLCWSYLSFLQFASFTISKSPSVVCAFYPWALKSHFHPGYSSVVKNHPLKTKFSYFFYFLFLLKSKLISITYLWAWSSPCPLLSSLILCSSSSSLKRSRTLRAFPHVLCLPFVCWNLSQNLFV